MCSSDLFPSHDRGGAENSYHTKGLAADFRTNSKEDIPRMYSFLQKNIKRFNIQELIKYDAPVIINSGYRTPSWNTKVAGRPNSYHCKGMAADIVVKGHSSKEVAKYADSIMEQGGVIRYTNFVHVDMRENRYRKGV